MADFMRIKRAKNGFNSADFLGSATPNKIRTKNTFKINT